MSQKERERKARYFRAKYEALSNADEFIRSHGEEGFSLCDEDDSKAYEKAKHELYIQLDIRANCFWEKYTSMGIEMDFECEQGC